MRDFLFPNFYPLPKIRGIWLVVTFDGIKAYLVCLSNCDFTKRFSPNTLESAVRALGLKSKINHQAVQKFSSLIGQGINPKPILIAVGRPPESSKEGSWVLNKSGISENTFPLEIPNYFSSESTICRFQSPGRGVPGIDVWAKHIKPFPNQKPEILDGMREEEDRIIAERDGFLFSFNGQWNLSEELSISGDKIIFCSPLKVSGSISIEGDLPENVEINSSKNVFIQGNCKRNVKIVAGKSVRVDGSIRHSQIFAKEGISCNSVFHSVLEAIKDIEIRKLLSGGSRVTAHGSFFARKESFISNSIVEAFKEADIWSCGGEGRGKTTIYVGSMRNIERKIQAYEEELSKILKMKDNVYQQFEAEYGHLIKMRHKIHTLPKKKRKEFEQKLSESISKQKELDEKISEITSAQNKLGAQKLSFPDAKIYVRNNVSGKTEFWVRKTLYNKDDTLTEAPFVICENKNKTIELHREENPNANNGPPNNEFLSEQNEIHKL